MNKCSNCNHKLNECEQREFEKLNEEQRNYFICNDCDRERLRVSAYYSDFDECNDYYEY